MAELIDQSMTFRLIEQRIAETTDPRHLMMLRRLLDHAKGEAEADIDRVMATLAPDPVYHSYGSPPALNPAGTAAIRAFYDKEVVAGGKYFFQFDLDRLVVDDRSIVTEGWYDMIIWGRDARASGLPAEDPDAFYLLHLRMIIVWPFDEAGYILGEDSYSAFTRPDFLEPIDESRLPAAYRRYIEGRMAAA